MVIQPYESIYLHARDLGERNLMSANQKRYTSRSLPGECKWVAKRGYEILTNRGLEEFVSRSTDYGINRLPDQKQLQVRLAKKRAQNLVGGNVVSNPLSYIFVDPSDVQYVTPVSEQTDGKKPDVGDLQQCIFDIPYGTFSPKKRFGSIVSGDWDRKETKFNQVFIYRSFKDHFVDGIPWEETPYVQRVADFYEERNSFKGYHSLDEFKEKRLPFLDELYEKIADGKYQTQIETGGSIFDEFTVNIGRDGEIFFNSNGAHRLSMCKLADIDEIPALVIVRHSDWCDHRSFIQRCKVQSDLTASKNDISHPDLKKVL